MKEIGPFFRRLRNVLAGGVWGGPGNAKTLLPFAFTACAALERPGFPGNPFSLFRQRLLSSDALCRPRGGHVIYVQDRDPDLGPVTQRWPF